MYLHYIHNFSYVTWHRFNMSVSQCTAGPWVIFLCLFPPPYIDCLTLFYFARLPSFFSVIIATATRGCSRTGKVNIGRNKQLSQSTYLAVFLRGWDAFIQTRYGDVFLYSWSVRVLTLAGIYFIPSHSALILICQLRGDGAVTLPSTALLCQTNWLCMWIHIFSCLCMWVFVCVCRCFRALHLWLQAICIITTFLNIACQSHKIMQLWHCVKLMREAFTHDSPSTKLSTCLRHCASSVNLITVWWLLKCQTW